MKSDAFSLVLPGLSAFANEWRLNLLEKRPLRERQDRYFMLFAASVLLSTCARTVGSDAGFYAALAALLGSVTCGWGWLFVRALFIPSREAMTAPLSAVLLILALQFASAAGGALGGGELSVFKMTDAAIGMVGSTFVILTLAEIIRHVPLSPSATERRFRQLFAAGYLCLLIVAVFMVRGASEGSFFASHTNTIQSLAALMALGGASLALRFRHRHPLMLKPAKIRDSAPSIEPSAAEERVARRVEELMCIPDVYTQPSLKVADVAAQLGEQEYLVSKAITQVLRQPNFNRYVNRFRIEQAQVILRDPEFNESSILVIALDCGFASIGPFNRAFRKETGMSPSAYRQSAREG